MTAPPDTRDMVLAFGFETARAIARADGNLAVAELREIESRFPRAELVSRGLIADNQLTPRFGHAYNLALTKLKSLLSESEKLALAEAFFGICRADAEIDGREIKVIVDSMRALGVSKADLAKYMRLRIVSKP